MPAIYHLRLRESVFRRGLKRHGFTSPLSFIPLPDQPGVPGIDPGRSPADEGETWENAAEPKLSGCRGNYCRTEGDTGVFDKKKAFVRSAPVVAQAAERLYRVPNRVYRRFSDCLGMV